MKTQKNILIAFILNLAFSIFELIGGLYTNSVAITSDAIHDFGDALSIGISLVLEKISRKDPDEKYTYGYARYSVLGALITTIVLVGGSILVIVGGISRIINPVEINYNGMIVFAIVGVAVNFLAAYFTREGDSINQKAVNLHMLEDVLGWVVVLIGSILMRFTDIKIIDPIMSICIAGFILFNAFGNLKDILNLFLEKAPSGVDVEEIRHHLMEIEGVEDVHHIHLWSLDGYSHYATFHIVAEEKDTKELKEKIREEMMKHNVIHTTIEIESPEEKCNDVGCKIVMDKRNGCGGHHHHHHEH